MTSEWKVQKISTLGEFDRGKSKHRPRDAKHLYGGAHPFIQTGDITNSGGRITSYRQTYSDAGLAQSKLWPAGTLAITIAANIAETALLTFPACFPDSVVGFTADPNKSDVRFVEYLFQAMRKKVKSHAYGSAQENINLAVLRNLEFPIPPLQLQTKIADYLSLLDDRITLLRETNQTLEAIAQVLFKSWFVDFDPVRAKVEGKLPAGIDAATAELFPDAFEESELGVVPKGWAFQAVGDLLVPKRGKSITKTKCVEGDIPVVAGGLEPAYFHNQSNVSSPVVTISASGANAGFVRLYQRDIWASDCSFVSAEQTEAIYFWYVFLKFNQEKIYFMQQGAAQPHIYPSDLIRLHICSSQTDKLRGAFNSLVSPLFDRIGLNGAKIHTLSNLRDTLLPRLISGQLRIADAEAELEKAKA